jgi:hypothetical protein
MIRIERSVSTPNPFGLADFRFPADSVAGQAMPTLLTWPASAIVHDIKGENWEITRPACGPESDGCCCSIRPNKTRRHKTHCRKYGVAYERFGTSTTSPTCWLTPKVRSSDAAIGKRPATPSCHSPCSLCEPDKTLAGVASVRSAAADQHDVERHDDDRAPGLGRSPPGDRLGRPRAFEQERQ